MNAAVGALLFAIALLGAITCAKAEDGQWGGWGAIGIKQLSELAQLPPEPEANSGWVKQVLRLEYTTFCQTVKKPPQQLVDAINEALKQDPKTWAPVVIWFNAIAEKYQKAGCGDA